MLDFKSFITEAKISDKNFGKAADIFKRMLEKKLSTKLYRFGGPNGYVPIKDGEGILYIYNINKALRINRIKGDISSITLWNSYRLGKKGEYTVDFTGLNLLQSAKKILDVVESPVVGKHLTYALSEEYIAEAKRISPSDFYSLVQSNLQTGEIINAMAPSRVEQIAIDNGVSVPSVIYGMVVPGTRGKTKRYDISKMISGKPTDAKPSKSADQYFIKVTKYDGQTGKFASVKGDEKAAELLNQIQGAVNEPDVKKQMRNPDSLFGIMKNLTQVVCRGARNSLIIYGGPGIGKSFVVNQTIKEEGLKKEEDYYIIKGKITTAALYQTLYMHRKGKLLIFDDADSVWSDAEAANILKAALDSYEERIISWYSGRTVNISKMSGEEKADFYDNLDDQIEIDPTKAKFPSEFPYEGRIIFISNLVYEKFDSAVLTRSAKIDMTLTNSEILARIESILEHLGDKGVSIDVKQEILEFLKQQTAKNIITEPSMRTFVAAEDLYKSGLPNWRELLDYV